eukprot:2200007-Pyramimonas_sp.AAC.1
MRNVSLLSAARQRRAPLVAPMGAAAANRCVGRGGGFKGKPYSSDTASVQSSTRYAHRAHLRRGKIKVGHRGPTENIHEAA